MPGRGTPSTVSVMNPAASLANNYALEVAPDAPAWSVETTSRPSVAPVVPGSAVYYGSGAYRVYARGTATDEKLWYRQTVWVPSDPALAGGTVFVTGKTQLVALRDS